MFQINPLKRKVLLTTDEVILHGPVADTVSPRNLLDAIIIAEERFLKQIMCKDFYYAFRDQKNQIVTSSNKDFLETHINEGNTGELLTLDLGDMVNSIDFVSNTAWVEWWYEFGWKIGAEAVVYTATPTNWSMYTSAGEMQNNPKSISNEGGGAVSVELKDVKWKMDKMLMDRLDPLIEASHEWLCDHRNEIGLYNCKKCACDTDNNGVSYQRKSPWIHGIYKTVTKGCCND